MKNEQELFNEIGNVLHTHEDAYQPGAWEEFVKTKKRRRGLVYLRFAAAAAVLLIVGYATWLFIPVKPVEQNQPQTKNAPKPPYIYQKNGPGNGSLTIDRAIASLKETNQKAPANTKVPAIQGAPTKSNPGVDIFIEMPPLINKKPETERIESKQELAVAPSPATDKIIANLQPEAITNTPSPVIANTEPRRYERSTQRLNYDSLANLNKPKPTETINNQNRALSYALMVSPSVGNQKMNFGTGVEVAYSINKNFAVSSGITYAYINAGSNRNGIPAEGKQADLRGFNTSFASPTLASSFSTSSSQTVQGVQMALSGFELPLSFQYKTPRGFYISAGVSAMSVIRNSISYDYVNSRTISTPSGNGLSPTISVITEKNTQQSAETVNGVIGFYTFSAGKKVSFGKGKLNFAPFIKVPFSRVSSENLQLMHGGVQLGFGF